MPLSKESLALLLDAARRDWSQVDPAIFGTLLERALNPKERHKLGAHYTPRAYVERLIRPTIEEPLTFMTPLSIMRCADHSLHLVVVQVAPEMYHQAFDAHRSRAFGGRISLAP